MDLYIATEVVIFKSHVSNISKAKIIKMLTLHDAVELLYSFLQAR